MHTDDTSNHADRIINREKQPIMRIRQHQQHEADEQNEDKSCNIMKTTETTVASGKFAKARRTHTEAATERAAEAAGIDGAALVHDRRQRPC